MKRNSYTVIIPTRERADTLEASLRSVASQSYEDLEVIVSDNFSGDRTEEVVQSFGDSRIRYINTGKRLSMSKNWEFALSHVTNDWLTIIGDDDALLPGCFERVNEIVEESGAQAVRSTTCSYQWPELNEGQVGRMTVPMGNGHIVRKCRQWMLRVLHGQSSYTSLPMLYNGGFISMKAVRRAMHQGEMYRSCIPDVYSAVAISNTLDRYAFSREPLAINGASRHSTGTSQFSGDSGSKIAAIKFQQEGNIPFHPSIPMNADGAYPKSLQAMVYESCAQFGSIRPETLNISPEQQVHVILSAVQNDSSIAGRWARTFCELHGLTFSEIAPAARRQAAINKIKQMVERIKTSADVEVWGDKQDIQDVFKASVIAGSLIESRSRLPMRVAQRVTAKLKRALAS